jgi:hypothetical protein
LESITPRERLSKWTDMLNELITCPEIPFIPPANTSKMIWKNNPINRAERNATIWLLVILLVNKPMLV